MKVKPGFHSHSVVTSELVAQESDRNESFDCKTKRIKFEIFLKFVNLQN